MPESGGVTTTGPVQFFAGSPRLHLLTALHMLFEKPGDDAPGKQVLRCRELIFRCASVLASPSDDGTSVLVVCPRPFDISQPLLEMRAKVLDEWPADAAMFATCLRYSLRAKLAPQWNFVGDLFVQGRQFLQITGPLNAVRLQIHVTGSDICLSTLACVIRLPRLCLADLGASPGVIGDFNARLIDVIGDSQMNGRWCHNLPSMKKGQVVGVSRRLLPSGPFVTYRELKRHWKNMYGYRLPEAEPSHYVHVNFRLVGPQLFTYPPYCLRSASPVFLARPAPRPILTALLRDLHVKVSAVCGQPLKFSGTPSYLTTQLRPAPLVDSRPNLSTTPVHQLPPPVCRQVNLTPSYGPAPAAGTASEGGANAAGDVAKGERSSGDSMRGGEGRERDNQGAERVGGTEVVNLCGQRPNVSTQQQKPAMSKQIGDISHTVRQPNAQTNETFPVSTVIRSHPGVTIRSNRGAAHTSQKAPTPGLYPPPASVAGHPTAASTSADQRSIPASPRHGQVPAGPSIPPRVQSPTPGAVAPGGSSNPLPHETSDDKAPAAGRVVPVFKPRPKVTTIPHHPRPPSSAHNSATSGPPSSSAPSTHVPSFTTNHRPSVIELLRRPDRPRVKTASTGAKPGTLKGNITCSQNAPAVKRPPGVTKTPAAKKIAATGEARNSCSQSKTQSKKSDGLQDVEGLAARGQLQRVSAATLLDWLRTHGQGCPTRTPKAQLVEKVQAGLGMSTTPKPAGKDAPPQQLTPTVVPQPHPTANAPQHHPTANVSQR